MPDNRNQNILDLASYFQQACGVACMIADSSSRSVLRASFCESCGYARCDFSSALLALSAETLGKGDATYRCPIGLSFAAAAFHGERGVTLIAGPFVAEDSHCSSGFELSGERYKNLTERLPRLSATRAIAIGELLAASAAGFNRVRPAAPGSLPKTARADAVRNVKEYISANYGRKFTLDDIARHVFLSRSYLSGIFKAETGKTLNAYVNEIRIEKSKALLCETPLSLLDIALLCGFEDQSYFSKVFKALEGVAPKDYRAHAFRFGWPES